jgi:DNA modification methylase
MRQGDVLLDCCAGSGSSLVAALVGIERDPIYYATALERLKQAHK